MSEVNWGIIDQAGHFYEPDEIQGEEDSCPECQQPRERQQKLKLKGDLFTEFAKGVAEAGRAARPKLTTNQLRNFYDVIKAAHDRLMQEPTYGKREDIFRIEKPRLKLLFSRIHYARSNGRIPNVFATFMGKCLEIVTADESKYRDFEAFVLTFEAVAGYFGKE